MARVADVVLHVRHELSGYVHALVEIHATHIESASTQSRAAGDFSSLREKAAAAAK